jgi:serine protease Do
MKNQGALVDEPRADSPAAKAGVTSGDVITAVNSTTVKTELARTIGTMAPNTSVNLDILRNGWITTLGQIPNEKQAN